MKVKDSEGNEIDVFSQAELDAKIAAEKNVIQKAADEQITASKTALDAALADKVKLEADLKAAADAGGDSQNFAALKGALNKKDEEVKALQGTVQQIAGQRLSDLKSEVLSRFAGNNEDRAKKILHHYDVTLAAVKAESKEEVATKMANAAKLAEDIKSPDLINQANFGGAGGNSYVPPTGGGTVELNAAQKALASKLGITEEDVKKYGSKLK